MSFRNRCRIAGAEGTIDLSIPLKKGRDQKTPIREVRTAASVNWQASHFKTILSCYSRSPWFGFYRDGLEALYSRPATFLVDWNLACFEWTLANLGISPGISFTGSWQPAYPEDEWLDWRGKLLPSKLDIRGTKGGVGFRASRETSQGPTAVIEAGAPHYRQVFEERTGFIPGLSILDLLFCEGKRAKDILAG